MITPTMDPLMITLLGRATGIAISTSRTLRAAHALARHTLQAPRQHDARTRQEVRIALANLNAAIDILAKAETLITSTITVEVTSTDRQPRNAAGYVKP